MKPQSLKLHQQNTLNAIRNSMRNQAIDALVVTDISVIRWLTGFSGSSAKVVITKEQCWLFTDFRYQEQVALEVDAAIVKTVITTDGFVVTLLSGNYMMGKTIALQAEHISWHDATILIEHVQRKQRVIPVQGFFNEFRMVKHELEIAKMRRAVEISETVFKHILPLISPSATELDIAAEITYQHKKLGAEKDAFEPIVAAGAHGAMPHAKPSNTHFKLGDLIVLDFGCVYEGYCSDQTRTVALGHVSDEAKQVYRIVQEAQRLGVERAQCGMSTQALDNTVRSYITERGYGEQFGHGLGHGVGVDVHEEPRISSKSKNVLQKGMVFTIEPGIYLAGKFGVRIEDTVVMGDDGAVPLQRLTKELLEL